ncbi:MAG: glycosyltransferase, partial [Candidatus Latescibacterota bacterium]
MEEVRRSSGPCGRSRKTMQGATEVHHARAACVINHNGEPCLASTLDALLAEGSAFDEIVLVDDASTDGSLDLTRRRFPGVRVLPLAENRGPAHARNVAFGATRAPRVLFVDNDVCVRPGSVRLLEEALDMRPAAVLAMPRVVFAHDPGTIQYDGAASHFLGVMIPENEGRPAAGAGAETR